MRPRRLLKLLRRRGRRQVYSIAIFTGPSPLLLAPAPGAASPAITATDVPGRPVRYVADPFLLRRDGAWHLFFEAVDAATARGAIAHAESADGLQWHVTGRVLEEDEHLSYPCAFEHEGEAFMVPQRGAGDVTLYRATGFPGGWVREVELLPGPLGDATLVERDRRWWMFAHARAGRSGVVARLFTAPALTGPWTEHPASPIVRASTEGARGAGRVVARDGSLYRLAQRTSPFYGMDVSAFRVTGLSEDRYAESPAAPGPILRSGPERWRRGGMHHLDAHELEDGSWLAAVDGWRWG